MRHVYCIKLHKEGVGLDFPPMPGPMGQKIYDSISMESWQAWMKLQTMLINEHRLNMTEASARTFLREEMQKFLFTDEKVSKPQGYVPPDEGTA